MKEKHDNTILPAGSDIVNSNSELNDNQEHGESENEDNNFHISAGDDHRDLGEVIRKWESFRYLI